MMRVSRRSWIGLIAVALAGASCGGRTHPVAQPDRALPAPAAKSSAAPAAEPAPARLVIPPLAQLPALDSYPLGVQRLARLGRLYGALHFLHPYLADRDIDLDAAVLTAITEVEAASNTQGYVDAVKKMLAPFDDPLTRVRSEEASKKVPYLPVATRTLDKKVLVVDLGTADTQQSYFDLRAVTPQFAQANAVIFDLRHLGPETWLGMLFQGLETSLISEPTEMPAERGILHSGFQPQLGGTSGGYYSAFVSTLAQVLEPIRAKMKRPERMVFLLGADGELPRVAVALQAQGRAALVAQQRELGDQSFATTTEVELGEGWVATVRTTEATFHGAPMSARADVVVPDVSGGDDSAGFRAALRLARDKKKWRPRRAAAPSRQRAPRWKQDPVYRDQKLPDRPLRVLAAFRLWNVIDRFYPYLPLIGAWDRVLPFAITELAAADSAEAYSRAVVRAAAYIADTHTTVVGGATNDLLRGVSPVGAELVEGVPVATEVDADAEKAGIRKGDIIETIDGRPFADVVAEVRPYVTASTEGALGERLMWAALGGKEGSQVTLGLRGADGPKQVTMTRVRHPRQKRDPSEPAYKLLSPALGYVDLRLLQPGEVDAMFEAMKQTRAILFDMRGYPNGTAWSIAPRLNRHPDPTVGARFQRKLVSGLEPGEMGQRFEFTQPMPESDDWKYTGKTFMLINQSTISQAEHTGLFFEAANGTEFIGTPSSGANGDVTNLALPGAIWIYFTGHDVRHADGRQLQRVGLVPDLRVAPTIAGIRAGKDEVLDAAIRYARDKTGIE